MQEARDWDLVPVDPEIECIFRHRRAAQQMANEQNRSVIPLNEGMAVEDYGNTVLGDFMALLVV